MDSSSHYYKHFFATLLPFYWFYQEISCCYNNIDKLQREDL